MSMKSILLVSAACFALNTAAFAADNESYQSNTRIDKDSSGNYAEKDTTTKTNADGTTTSFEKKADVSVDSNGDVAKSTTTKKVTDATDPFNKHTVKTSNTEQTKDGMVKTGQSVTVGGKTIDSKTETTQQ